jgi:hypothetical protein
MNTLNKTDLRMLMAFLVVLTIIVSPIFGAIMVVYCLYTKADTLTTLGWALFTLLWTLVYLFY